MLSNSRIIWFAKQWPHQDVARLEVAVRDGVLAVRPLDLRVQVRQPARERVHQPDLLKYRCHRLQRQSACKDICTGPG